MRRVFYGWIVVAATFTILTTAYGIQFSYGLFMVEMQSETGWDRAGLSLPYSVFAFVYGVLSWVTGRATDRYGPRAVLALGGGLLGLGYALVGTVVALWQLYLFLGAIAALGMSAVYVPCNATVVRWFVRRRGLALSFSSSGASFGNFVVPPLAAAGIAVIGWRETLFWFGLCGGLLIAVCAYFVVRDPEAMGLAPDGLTEALGASQTPDHQETALPWTLASAQRTLTFWLVTAIFALTWLVVFLPMVHLAPHAIDLGISPLATAGVVSAIGAGGVAGRLLTGTLSDRFGRLPVLGLCLLLQVLSFLGFGQAQGLLLLHPAAAAFGFSYGGSSVLFPAIVGDFFGREAVGSIVGFIFALAGSAAAFGPYLAGVLYDTTGRYQEAFWLSAALNGASLALLLLLRRPVPPPADG